MIDDALKYAQENAEGFRSQLHDLLRIPCVSTDPERADAMQEAAEWVAENMRQAGLENITLMPTAGYPVVYGDWLHAGDAAPTLLVYGHYDVQPAVKEDGWDSEPFEPVERDGKIFARGASDDKGQMFIHIKAAESLLKTEGKLPVNLKFLIEGEEEIGSENLPPFLKAHRDKFSADAVVISDTGMRDIDQPMIVNGLRGMVALELIVQGPNRDLHSGGYGGAVHNPVQALAEIIAKLHDDNGRVTVPGFYNDVLELTPADREEMAKTNHTDDAWKAMTGIPAIWGEPEFAINERLGARPTLEINGMAGGFYGEGMKTVLPAKAIGKITCRLVPHQNPQQIFDQIKAYVQDITPPTVTCEVRQLVGVGDPVLIDTDSTAMQAAISAYEKGWGNAPIFIRGGGTLPIVADFQRELDAPIILMGYGLNSDGAHGPNESYTIEMFHKGIDTAIHFMHELAQSNGG